MDIDKTSDIYTKNDLIQFLEKSLIELKENPGSWENTTLYDYLATMVAWLEDSDQPETPTWETFARILYASKHYE